jgi:hypothetical protein
MKNERKVKCPVCESYNYKEEAIYHQKRYYCEICYKNKTKEADNYKNLIQYICDIYEIKVPTGFMFTQIKNFKEQYNYTYKGMELTLDYFYNVKTNDTPDINKGLGIIPYIYEEAKQFFIEKRNIKKNLESINIQDITDKVNVISIKKSDKKIDQDYKNIAIIDITEI